MTETLAAYGTIVTGDGISRHPDSHLVISGGLVEGITRTKPGATRVLSAQEGYIFPGFFNHHTHGLTLGPLFASGALPLEPGEVRSNLDTHLAWGTTLALNVDGLALPSETLQAGYGHPLHLVPASCHTPSSLESAGAADGLGLGDQHRRMRLREAVLQGARAVGEVGSGHTLGGGGQEYMYIPRAVEEATGSRITPAQARALKLAVLGPSLDTRFYDPQATRRALKDAGLAGSISSSQARDLIVEAVTPSLAAGLKALEEGVRAARDLRLPCILHCARPSVETIAELARAFPDVTLVAAHVNHDSFTIDEAVGWSEELSRLGAVVDAGVFDAFGLRISTPNPRHLLALAEAGRIDLLSTDYGGGNHDPLLRALREIVRLGLMDLPSAVALVSGNPARVFPEAAEGRGILESGSPGDFCVVDRHLARILYVVVGGQVVFQGTP